MQIENIHQKIDIRSSSEAIYEAFMNERKHAEFTGYNARIENKTGGKFVTCGERNYGYNLYLLPGQRIIQAWSHRNFPDNHYSIIDIKLLKREKSFTQLIFNHIGAPCECIEWLAEGWQTTYWNPLKKYLEEGVIQSLKE